MNDKSAKVSPTIPVFKMKTDELADCFLEEWLGVLATENAANMDAAETRTIVGQKLVEEGRFKNGVPVKLIFGMCAHLKQSNQVKYQAIELYDSFMQTHIAQLMDDFEKECSAVAAAADGRRRRRVNKPIDVNWKQNKRWLDITGRVMTQSLLRVLTCIQIAGKFHDPKTAIKVAVMEQLLNKANNSYGVKAIQSSELRVLETVSFNPAVQTPLVYLEALLVILGRNDDAVNVEVLYRVSIQVLDLFYLRRSEVYTALSKKFNRKGDLTSVDELNTPALIPDKRKQSKRKRSQPMPPPSTTTVIESNRGLVVGCRHSAITKNLMLLSAALISCAAYHIDQVGYLKVVERLHFITRVAYHEIIEFTIVLVDELFLANRRNDPVGP